MLTYTLNLSKSDRQSLHEASAFGVIDISVTCAAAGPKDLAPQYFLTAGYTAPEASISMADHMLEVVIKAQPEEARRLVDLFRLAASLACCMTRAASFFRCLPHNTRCRSTLHAVACRESEIAAADREDMAEMVSASEAER